MSRDDVPLYVRLPADQAQRLNAAASTTGRTKRQLVENAVRDHLAANDGLVLGRAVLREDAPEVLTLEEAATLLRVGDAALRDSAERRELPGREIGGQWRFSRAALLAWLARSDPATATPHAPGSD